MATREENLKKINYELEQLSDEELENIAGGNFEQTADDSQFLYKHGLVDDWHGFNGTVFKWKSVSREVDDGWAKAGITCCTSPFNANKYWHGGKEISRDEAIKIVESKFKKIH